MDVNTTSDQNLIGWLIKGLAAIVMLLLSMGVKDIRERVRNAEQLEPRVGILEYEVKTLRERVEALERKI